MSERMYESIEALTCAMAPSCTAIWKMMPRAVRYGHFPHGKTAETGASRAQTSLSALGAAVSAGTAQPFVNSCAGGISLLEAYGGELLLLRSRQTSPPWPASALRQSGNLRLRTFPRGGSIPAADAACSSVWADERLSLKGGAPLHPSGRMRSRD